MIRAAILRLYTYTETTTTHVLTTCEHLTPNDFTRPVIDPHPSLRDTLTHLISTQRVHLDWWNGTLSGADSCSRHFPPDTYPDLEAVQTFWRNVTADTQTFLDTLSSDSDLERTLVRQSGPHTVERPLWESMLHVANHATQHRSEAALLFTTLGHSPGDLDLL